MFPPRPTGLRGRSAELATLASAVDPLRRHRLALVGQGGSGKSMLACALGHRVKARFPGGIHWFRVGAWDARTLGEMLALRFGTPRGRSVLFQGLRRFLTQDRGVFVVLDNHEDDRAMARLLDELRDAHATWVITARRCLLSGVSIFPVTAPLVTSGKSAFPRVAPLTGLLRYNPLALDIADALVSSGEISVGELAAWLIERGVDRVRAIDHEDDLPEVALLVDWAWPRVGRRAQAMMVVLSQMSGDHMDRASLLELSRSRANRSANRSVPSKVSAGMAENEGLERLRRLHLVQEPFADRYALHAVVRHAVRKRTLDAMGTNDDPTRAIAHYLALLERSPERFDLEQTHLFAAMDFAHTSSSLGLALRIDRLLETLSASRE